MQVSGVYIIYNNITGKCYVGQSVNVRARMYEHRRRLRGHTHKNPHLQASWDAHGEGAFEFRLHEEVAPSELDARENFWISFYDSTSREKGYNSESFARGTGPRSKEAKKNMSLAAKKALANRPEGFYSEIGRRNAGVKKGPPSQEHKDKLAQYTQERNSQWGTCWVHLGELNKKVLRSTLQDHLPLGWVLGRFISEEQKLRMLESRSKTKVTELP